MSNEPKSKKELKQDAEKRELRKYGRPVAEARSQWGNLVTIYAKGFISIRGLFGTLETPEKLVSIEFVDQYQPFARTSAKINEGRARDSYLIFVTDQRSDTLHWSDNSNSKNAEIMSLVASARAAIAGTYVSEDSGGASTSKEKTNPFKKGKTKESTAPATDSEGSVSKELAALIKMHKDGDITAAEFKLAKKKLLESGE